MNAAEAAVGGARRRFELRAVRGARGTRTLEARALRQTLQGNGHPARSIHIGTL
jgi:hypothetical protein